MRYNKAIAQARSMLDRALHEDNVEQVAYKTGLLLELQKSYIHELEKERIMKIFKVTFTNGVSVEIGARNEKEARALIQKEYDYFIKHIEVVR